MLLVYLPQVGVGYQVHAVGVFAIYHDDLSNQDAGKKEETKFV